MSIPAAIGRLMISIIFIYSGVAKLMAPAATIAYIASSGLPFGGLAMMIAVAVELGGGMLLMLGFQTRPVAAGLALFSLVTGLAFHHAIGDQSQLLQLLKNIAMAGGLLQVVAFGAGVFSLDHRAALRAGRAA